MKLIRLVCICVYMLMTIPAWGTEFSVSPMLIDFQGRAGTREPFEIYVAGTKAGKIVLSVYAMKQQESGHMSFIESHSNQDQHKAVNWIRFERDDYKVKKNETTTVRGVIEIPRNERGTYLAAVMIEEETNDSTNNVSIKVRYAVILNINIDHLSGRLTTSFDNLSLIEREGATYVEGYFTNNNSFMGMLDSQVQIRYQDRRLLARLQLKTESAWQRGDATSRVYPGARVKVAALLEAGASSGKYNILVRNKLGGRSLPTYRNEFVHHSHLEQRSIDSKPFQISPDRITVSPLGSGLSITSISVSNNLNQIVTIDLPDGSDKGAGIERFEFIPKHITLRPGMRQRVLLKQMHVKDIDYPGRKFVLAATLESGIRQDLVVSTFPEKS